MTCYAINCERPDSRKGLCTRHSQVKLRHGDENYQLSNINITKDLDRQCIIEDCERIKSKGKYCGSHRARLERYGSPTGTPKPRLCAPDIKGYTSWQQARTRCTNPLSKDYKHYGARGIEMDPRWVESFWSFYKDMGERPENTTLDRIDNEGNYTKNNCRWANHLTQANNRRNTRHYYFQGRLRTIREIASISNKTYGLIKNRLVLGWTIEEAALVPVGHPRTND